MKKEVSKLRTEFIKYMVLRNFAPKTQDTYIGAVKGFAKHYNKSPDQLSPNDVREYLIFLKQIRKVHSSTYHVTRADLVCFCTNILKWKREHLDLPPHKREKGNPKILSVQEVQKLLNAVFNRKHKTMLMTAYGTGLRVSELVALKPIHIESDRMLVRVEQGKGQKDRYTIFPERLLQELRDYWQLFKPKVWLFPGSDNKQMCRTSAHRIYTNARKKAVLYKIAL